MRHSAAYQVPLESLDVVVVEDSKQMQTIIRSVLGAMRVQRVRTFDSAEKALQAMLSEPPHLIIIDWRMEPITGYQFLRSIRHRQMAPLCFVPVLMITAHGIRSLVGGKGSEGRSPPRARQVAGAGFPASAHGVDHP
ncbi:response regulator [Breoghania sp.]|uniref:response regulator n=1 Tax=Breoghania sp. TaxID=2065378 RepID=UPI002612FD68|nr:response regulator [Breoghania sp.]MDJ0932887.1 response regulator [Breoghania sp.]